MTAITGGTNVHNEHVPSGKENGHNGEANPGPGNSNGASARFWAGVFKWDNRLKALAGLGIGGLVLVAGIFLVKSVIPAAVRQAVQPMFSSLEQDMAEVKEDVAALKRDMADVKRDMADVKEDLAEVKEDLGQVKEDIIELREGQAYIRGQVELLVRFVSPERPGVPE